ncbi:MAG: TIGR04282 family arsenosugar biosynthesis glycosyltransferase [Planctomycetota bacterium]
MRETALVILARAPERGRVKTRLASAIGDEPALAVYRDLLAITARAATAWHGPRLLLTRGDPASFAGTGLDRLRSAPQIGGPLGAEIAHALSAGLSMSKRALVIGSDCPGLSAERLAALAGALREVGASVGPAEAGGFWALGASDGRVAKAVLAVKRWSSSDTLRRLESALADLRLAVCFGETLFDCDDEEDLRRAVSMGLVRDPRTQESAP